MSGSRDSATGPIAANASGHERFTVSVLMERQPVTGNRWVSERWAAVGVVAGDAVRAAGEPVEVRAEGVEQVLYPGFELELWADDAPSYYNNLMAARPSVFVVCAEDEDGGPPRPAYVTVSYGEASACMETDEPVFSVPIPPELYAAMERFVLEHYVPEAPRKRKRVDWKKDGGRGGR